MKRPQPAMKKRTMRMATTRGIKMAVVLHDGGYDVRLAGLLAWNYCHTEGGMKLLCLALQDGNQKLKQRQPPGCYLLHTSQLCVYMFPIRYSLMFKI